MVSAINPSVTGNVDSVELASLQQVGNDTKEEKRNGIFDQFVDCCAIQSSNTCEEVSVFG